MSLEPRRAALHFLTAACLWGLSVALWVLLLSFDVADWPSASAWPHNEPTANWLGWPGAWLAHALVYYLGGGAVALALLVSAIAFMHAQRLPLTDLWLRAIGVILVCSSVGALAAMHLPASRWFLVSGPGGLVGAACAHLLQKHVSTFGAWVVLLSALLVGLALSIDHLAMAFLRWFIGATREATPALLRTSGEALATVGGAVAGGVSMTAQRLSSGAAAWRSARVALSPESGPAKPAATEPASRRPTARISKPVVIAADEDEDDEPSETETPPLTVRRAVPAARASDESTQTSPVRHVTPPRDVPSPARSVERAPVPIEPALPEALDESEDDSGPDADAAPPVVAPPKVTTLGSRTVQRALPLEQRALPGNFELPPLALLEEPEPLDKSSIEVACREKAYVLEQTLNEFRLEVQVVAIETGPVITVFELKLAPGIKVSQIASLTNDMARALRAPAVRVVAPLPGKTTIGIEVPNVDKEKVRLKDLILQSGARAGGFEIPLCLGKDASGAPLVSDLTKMPHLLIAGTTGSGKSICVSSIIMSILLTRSPDEVQMILTDPKVVELAMFKDIPHLMCPIVTEMTRAEGILDWATTKMDERYALLAEAGVKDIRSYNKLGREGLRERMEITTEEEWAQIPIRLPYIVIVIDELADLMMTAAKEVEFYLCRLAQKSRAVGIHLIVSTQRPQANVVTGLIKSNLPSRICFRVSSRLDSRIVLDQNGGEVLMGQGDMLFLPPGSAKLVRAQGTYISDDELRAVVRHARSQGQPQYHPELMRQPKAEGDLGERDELFDQAVEIILETGRGSVSLLQRRLTIGYGRASRLVDQMAMAGIVGDYKGSQAREVMLTRDEWHALRSQRDREERDENG